MRACALVIAVVAALGAAGLTTACSNDAETPTTPSPAPTSPTTTTFASRLTVNGAVSRSFTATQAGTVTVLLTNAGGPSTRVGLGLGVPTTGLARCSLTTAMVTTPGATPQIAAAVDAGSYCVTIYDVGTLIDTIDFSITVVYP